MSKGTSGVYAITCIPTGRRYIGSSGNVQARRAQHLHKLRHGLHLAAFQADWDLHGESAFTFTLIAECADPAERVEIEQAHINAARAAGLAYNRAPHADSNLGVRHTAETREKVGSAGRGRPKSAEHRRKIGDAHRGRPKSEAQRAKTSARKRGEGNQNAKLTEDSVREIKRRIAAGEPLLSIAEAFEVDRSTVGSIKQGRRWRHVTI